MGRRAFRALVQICVVVLVAPAVSARVRRPSPPAADSVVPAASAPKLPASTAAAPPPTSNEPPAPSALPTSSAPAAPPAVSPLQPAATVPSPSSVPPLTPSSTTAPPGSGALPVAPRPAPAQSPPSVPAPNSGETSPTVSPSGAASPGLVELATPHWDSPSAPRVSLLEAAEQAALAIDYEQGVLLAERAIEQGGLGRDELRRAYVVLAFGASQLDRPDLAQPAFLKLFALDPNVDFSKRLAPARRSSATVAHDYWSAQLPTSVNVELDRGAQQLAVQIQDPLGWLATARVRVRKRGGAYVEHSVKAGVPTRLTIDAAPLDVVEVYAVGLDSHGNTVVEVGSAARPQALEPSVEDEIAFDREVRGGETGGAGKRLEALGVMTKLTGYTSLEFGQRPIGEGTSFDLRHTTLYARAELPPRVSLEVGLDFEHLAATHRELTLPHAFMDVAICHCVVVRAGFFEAPIGSFNEYLYPDFVRTTALTPLLSTAVVPSLWSEVGLQLRGRIPVASRAHLTYAVFVSNGLEQADAAVGDGVVEEGAELRTLRFNVRDEHDNDKAVGGRVGMQWRELDVGISAYTGRYTIDADRRLTIADVDVGYKSRYVAVRAEAASAFQATTDGTRVRQGAYLLVSSRAEAHLEPYVQYDVLRNGSTVHRVLLGNAIYPFPDAISTRTLRLKTEVGVAAQSDRGSELVWLTQLVSGF